MPRSRPEPLAWLGASILVAVAFLAMRAAGPEPLLAASLASGFSDGPVITGLDHPTAVRFAPDGRIFVAEKRGRIKVYTSLSDTNPAVYTGLETAVHNYWDRGLLGIALDPGYPTRPYLYVLYTFDHIRGDPGSPPKWGDLCPWKVTNPDGSVTIVGPGGNTDGCVVSGRVSRFNVSGSVSSWTEQVLIEDWCQQFPSHSIGSLGFGPDGMLYVSAGDGASFNSPDYGQFGGTQGSPPFTPVNPCADPSLEGGALRSQDLRTSGDPTSLDGAILRVDPDTGLAASGNPLAASPDVNARRIVAEGLRNPFRFTVRPGTSELWIGDVGWGNWEEVDRLVSPAASVRNFGWPCYEGNGRQGSYDALENPICESLYAAEAATPGTVVRPYWTYAHGQAAAPGDTCDPGSSSVSGLAFYTGSLYPSTYVGALFVADYSRDCIWVLPPGGNGLPSVSSIAPFAIGASNPVELTTGIAGDLFYPDFDGGAIRRIRYNGPVAAIAATPSSGAAPLTVQFDGTGSVDPNGDPLSYAWDLDGDGQYDDSMSARPAWTYENPGVVVAALRVTDPGGLSDTASMQIQANNSPPSAAIDSPTGTFTWAVGDQVAFAGRGVDPQDGALPAAALHWSLDMLHCPSSCHVHHVQDFDGVSSGSFTAPDHEYPSRLRLTLTVTDSGGLTASTSVEVQPKTATLSFASSPTGLVVSAAGSTATTPFTRTYIVGSVISVAAATPQDVGGTAYTFSTWSDGGAAIHDITVPAAPATLTASYEGPPRPNVDPVAVDDQAQVPTGSANALIPVLANDSDPDGDALAIDSVSPAAHGAVSITGDGTGLVYTPESGYVGPDAFTYTVADGHGGSATAGVQVTVTDPNAPPDQPGSCAGARSTSPLNTWLADALPATSDVDWFRFSLTKSATVQVVLGNLPADYRLALYSTCSTLVASSNVAGTGYETIMRWLPAGTYRVRVWPASGAVSPTRYALRFRTVSSGLRVLSSSTWLGSDGRLHVTGELYNNSSSRRRHAVITARFYDARGRLLATRTAGSLLSIVAPWTRAPFAIALAPPAGFARLTLAVTSDLTSSSPLGGLSIRIGDATTTATGWRVVAGSLGNANAFAVRSARVIVTLYDTRGLVSNVGWATPGSGTIAAKGSAVFTITIAERHAGTRSAYRAQAFR